MKPKLFFIFLSLTITSLDVIAQKNLVYNRDFERHQFHYLVSGFPTKKSTESPTDSSLQCVGWYTPDWGTPDCFYKDNYKPEFRTPCSPVGCYTAHSGDGYIGIILISVENAYMEHIQSKLTETLKKGHTYEVSFWVRFAYQFSDYSTYNIGAFLSKQKEFKPSFYPVGNYINSLDQNYKAQIANPAGNFITDTTWVQIKGDYTANGGEQYITIGMFWDDNPQIVQEWKKNRQIDSTGEILSKSFSSCVKKNLLKVNPMMLDKYKNSTFKVRQHFPYYLIDDVSVIEKD